MDCQVLFFQVLEAEDGASAIDWPAYTNGHVHGSPFMFDIDRDGILDIGVGTYEGDIIWFKDTVRNHFVFALLEQ